CGSAARGSRRRDRARGRRARRSSPRRPPQGQRRRDDAGGDAAEREDAGEVAVPAPDDDPRRAAADEERRAHHERAVDELADVAAEVERRVLAVPLRRDVGADHDADDGEERPPLRARGGDEQVPALEVVHEPARQVAPVAGRAEAVGGRRVDPEPLDDDREHADDDAVHDRGPGQPAEAPARDGADGLAGARGGPGGHFAAQAVEWLAALVPAPAAGTNRRPPPRSRPATSSVTNGWARNAWGTLAIIASSSIVDPLRAR